MINTHTGGTNDIHENLARKRRLSESSNSNSSKKKKPIQLKI